MKTRPEENIRGKHSGCKVCYYTHLRRMCIKFKVLSQVDTTHDQTAIKLVTFTLKHSDIRLSASGVNKTRCTLTLRVTRVTDTLFLFSYTGARVGERITRENHPLRSILSIYPLQRHHSVCNNHVSEKTSPLFVVEHLIYQNANYYVSQELFVHGLSCWGS